VDLSDLSPDLIERIEIIRGPQSALYGADAIGGVVNIITRRGAGKPFQASVQQEVGNYDTLASRATVSGAYKILNYALSASHLESNGQFKNDETDVNALSGRVGATLPWNRTLDFIFRYNKNDVGVPVKGVFPGPQPIDPIINPNARQQSETTIFSLEGKTRPVEWWESRVRLSRYQNSEEFQDPVDPGVTFDVPVFSQVDVERREAEWINSFFIGKWSTSSIGLEYRREEGESKGTFSAATGTRSVFLEQQLRFFERLFVTGGFRVEDNSVFGTTITERGSVAFLIKETGTRLRGSAGTGFRAPTFNDLFFPGFGNPTLEPERSLSYDFGVDQRLWTNRIRLGLTYFQNNFEKLITCCVPLPTAPFGGPINVGRARRRGHRVHLRGGPAPEPGGLAQLHLHGLRGPLHRPAAPAGAAAPLEHRPHLGADRAPLPLHPGAGGDRAVRAFRRGVQPRLHAGGPRGNMADPRARRLAPQARADHAHPEPAERKVCRGPGVSRARHQRPRGPAGVVLEAA
jgi:vitamin B12 transporter